MKLLTHLSLLMESQHYSERTISQYKFWITDYIRFHYKQHPAMLSEKEVRLYLNSLRYYRRLSRYKQAQCEAALLYLYRNVLGITDFHITDEHHPVNAPHPAMLDA